MQPSLVRTDTARPDDELQLQFTVLFDRLRLPVCRYLTLVLGRTGEAEELTQEAFLRLAGYLKAGNRAEEARFWLFRIAHNLAVNVLRRRRFTIHLQPDHWERLCRQTADTSSDAEDVLVDRQKRQRLATALALLSPRERRCLALRAEGLLYREIAVLFDVSHAAAVDSARRALRKLTRALKD